MSRIGKGLGISVSKNKASETGRWSQAGEVPVSAAVEEQGEEFGQDPTVIFIGCLLCLC